MTETRTWMEAETREEHGPLSHTNARGEAHEARNGTLCLHCKFLIN